MINNNPNIMALDDNQKVNYVKSLLFNRDINDALDTIIKVEKKDLKLIKIILDVLNEELLINRIKEQCNLSDKTSVKLFVYSRIIAMLSFYNKSVILNNFFKQLSNEELKQVAAYEYQNKTDVSFNSKIFNKYCLKYKNEALNSFGVDEEEILMLDEEKEKYNSLLKKKDNKKRNFIILFILLIIIVVSFLLFKFYDYNKLINKYNGLIYPGIYLNDIDLSGEKVSNLDKIIEKEKSRIENGSIIVTNENGDYKFTYKEIGILANDTGIKEKIEKYNDSLSFFKKVKMIGEKKKVKTFYLKSSSSDRVVDNFVELLEEKLNVNPRNDGIVIDDNHNVYYDKGINGFTLDKKKTKIRIKEALTNLREETVIEAVGTTIKNEVKNENLSSINKKVSSYTTYFANYGNRGHNINLASSKLNGTVIMPGEEFSYLKVVGPYGASNGYLPAPIYLNGDNATANGGGVCQLASTLYMAQLKAGLQTISRRNHTFAPNYVPKGLDATVYSTTTDFKFKNNYDYPIYIVSYVKGNYLTVDIWTNENALGGKTFEPYSVYSNGGYLAYLKIIENGKVIETKYLGKSVYKTR